MNNRFAIFLTIVDSHEIRWLLGENRPVQHQLLLFSVYSLMLWELFSQFQSLKHVALRSAAANPGLLSAHSHNKYSHFFPTFYCCLSYFVIFSPDHLRSLSHILLCTLESSWRCREHMHRNTSSATKSRVFYLFASQTRHPNNFSVSCFHLALILSCSCVTVERKFISVNGNCGNSTRLPTGLVMIWIDFFAQLCYGAYFS